MCNLGEAIEREGIAKGVVASINNLMKNTGWPIEQALSTLEVPKEQWDQYVRLLTNQGGSCVLWKLWAYLLTKQWQFPDVCGKFSGVAWE